MRNDTPEAIAERAVRVTQDRDGGYNVTITEHDHATGGPIPAAFVVDGGGVERTQANLVADAVRDVVVRLLRQAAVGARDAALELVASHLQARRDGLGNYGARRPLRDLGDEIARLCAPPEQAGALADYSVYYVVRFAPSSLREEFVNLGVAACGPRDEDPVAYRWLADRARAEAFCGQSLEWVRRVTEEDLRTHAELRSATVNWAGSLQISGPRASTLSPEALLERVAEMYLPPARDR